MYILIGYSNHDRPSLAIPPTKRTVFPIPSLLAHLPLTNPHLLQTYRLAGGFVRPVLRTGGGRSDTVAQTAVCSWRAVWVICSL